MDTSIDQSNVDALVDDVAGHLNALHGRLIDVTIWLLANKHEWQGDGLWTPGQYLAWRTGVSPAVAASLVAAAERSHEFPVALDKVRRGEMSLDQLMPIIRKVPAWADAQVTSLAHKLTVSQVRRLVSDTDWAWAPAPTATADEVESDCHSGSPTDSDRRAHRSDDPDVEPDLNRVNYGFDDNGRWFLHADLDADLGAQIHQSLDEARDALFRERNHRGAEPTMAEERVNSHDEAANRASHHGTLETDTRTDPNVMIPVSDADALTSIAIRSLDGVASPDRRDRFRANLFLNTNGSCVTTEHITLPDSLRDLITCDGRIDPVFVDDATPVSIGRSSRVIPERLRRVVLHRDHGCCQVPGCTATRGLDLHHIVHWSHGGPTDSANLITVCSRHHRLHHKRRLGIVGNADDPSSLEFTNHRGNAIRASGASPSEPHGPPPPIIGEYEHPIGERLDRRWVTFVNPAVERHQRSVRPTARQLDTG